MRLAQAQSLIFHQGNVQYFERGTPSSVIISAPYRLLRLLTLLKDIFIGRIYAAGATDRGQGVRS